MFSVFDQDALLEALKQQSGKISRITSVEGDRILTDEPISIDEWDKLMTNQIQTANDAVTRTQSISNEVDPHYADEIPPFDITISFSNEYGQKSVAVLYGVEILNEGTGFSTDTVTSERACTFVARRLDPMRPVKDEVTSSSNSN